MLVIDIIEYNQFLGTTIVYCPIRELITFLNTRGQLKSSELDEKNESFTKNMEFLYLIYYLMTFFLLLKTSDIYVGLNKLLEKNRVAE